MSRLADRGFCAMLQERDVASFVGWTDARVMLATDPVLEAGHALFLRQEGARQEDPCPVPVALLPVLHPLLMD